MEELRQPTMTNVAAYASKPSPFLNILPCELRLEIYFYLLVRDTPLKGCLRRRTTKYGLDLAILRVNRQIFNEASPVFFGENVFHITPSPPLHGDGREGYGAMEPPLQLTHLALVHHLEIDVLYPLEDKYPSIYAKWDKEKNGHPAERYMKNLSFVLDAARGSLRTLQLHASPTRWDCYDWQASFDWKLLRKLRQQDEFTKCLRCSEAASESQCFQEALSRLPFPRRTLHLQIEGKHYELVFENSYLTEETRAMLATTSFPWWYRDATDGVVRSDKTSESRATCAGYGDYSSSGESLYHIDIDSSDERELRELQDGMMMRTYG